MQCAKHEQRLAFDAIKQQNPKAQHDAKADLTQPRIAGSPGSSGCGIRTKVFNKPVNLGGELECRPGLLSRDNPVLINQILAELWSPLDTHRCHIKPIASL